ncbi:prepilin-type N-terminal cleavage/methylation domain-containing protein [Jatrophihabitans cynanchi]|jgi:type IV pilus assembly protein PilA|uniref:prepilin-type N-terminal cleavage/methylation domain-containing protein n=1 Tax=Jatrophihabitans cynanchi TaxID=2944128 RepID=UPI0022B224ED|nr:prepilin-type N-terminal cleavage/methylation domain-containing protein [Jatrophihabitans sp. SB3-54]
MSKDRVAHDRGFTLIELLVVVVIIGVLIAIAIPLYLNYRKNATDKAAQSDLRNAVVTLEHCRSNNNGYPSDLGPRAGDAYASLTGCSDARINLSGKTTLIYTAFAEDHLSTCSSAPCETYSLTATDTDGGKTFSYQSWTAGSIT